ncbi:MAG: nuclear transport factor 2 family protein [Pseudomonadota bacterium]|nr:nuclear transport factor 2 family protein [Pseudomonadota bacterium]
MHLFSLMRMAVLASAACCSVVSAQQASTDSAAVTELVRKFGDAQRNPDPVALRALTSTQFIEISPLGDVDPRDKMIGFYVKDPARIPPQVTIDEQTVRVFGDSAIVNLRLTLNANGQARSLRSSYVAHKEGAEWKMVSAQHTPMRPAKP